MITMTNVFTLLQKSVKEFHNDIPCVTSLWALQREYRSHWLRSGGGGSKRGSTEQSQDNKLAWQQTGTLIKLFSFSLGEHSYKHKAVRHINRLFGSTRHCLTCQHGPYPSKPFLSVYLSKCILNAKHVHDSTISSGSLFNICST